MGVSDRATLLIPAVTLHSPDPHNSPVRWACFSFREERGSERAGNSVGADDCLRPKAHQQEQLRWPGQPVLDLRPTPLPSPTPAPRSSPSIRGRR